MSRINRLLQSYGKFIAIPWRCDAAAAQRVIFCVYNKMDQVEHDGALPLLRKRFGDGVCVSARTGDGLALLRGAMCDWLDRNARHATLVLPVAHGRLQAYLTEHADILTREYTDSQVTLEVRISPRHLGVARKMGAKVLGEPVGEEAVSPW